MAKIIAAGLVNIETTLKIDSFPCNYEPVRYPFFGIASTVTGVGVNVAKALKLLGDDVHFLSIIGNDYEGDNCIREFEKIGIDTSYIVKGIRETPQSVIMYEPSGRRMIHVDLKDIQESTYPVEIFEKELNGCDMAVICNINFSRPFLKMAKERGVPVATDVHVIADISDAYNSDYMAYSDILFMSNENIMGKEREFVLTVYEKYKNKIIVVGMGKEGALLYADNKFTQVEALNTRPVINTIGAGDSLFTSFIHYYLKSKDPVYALKKGVIYASWKIGEKGAAEGLMTENECDTLFNKYYNTDK